MLWYKSWLETRWRFLIGLALLMLSAAGTVLYYPHGHGSAAAGLVDRDQRRARPTPAPKPWSSRDLPRLRLVTVVRDQRARSCGRSSPCCSAPAACCRRGRAAARCSRCRCRSRATACSAFAQPPGWRSSSSIAFVSSSGAAAAVARRRPELQPRRRPRPRRCACSSAGAVLFSLATLLSTVFNDVWRPALIVLCGATLLALTEAALRDLTVWPLRDDERRALLPSR